MPYFVERALARLLQHVRMQLLHAWLRAGRFVMRTWRCTCTALLEARALLAVATCRFSYSLTAAASSNCGCYAG